MNIRRFIETYRLAILDSLLKDKDFDVRVYYNDDLIETNELIVQSKANNEKADPKTLNPDFLKKCINDKDINKILNGSYILTIEDLKQIKEIEPDFINISRLSTITWSDEVIETFIDNWNWSNLSANHSIKWTQERVETFINFIDFSNLSYNSSLEVSRRFIDKYSNKWNWEALSGNPSVAKKLGISLFDHKQLVWRPKLKKHMYWTVEETIKLYEFNSYYRGSDITPSVSSNPEFVWTLDEFEKQKDKIDFWVLAYYGKLSNDIIYKYGDVLNDNRLHHYAFHRYSDNHDYHPVYRNGWENLIANRNFNIDSKMLQFLNEMTATLIYHTGDASKGFQKRFEKKPLIQLNIDSSRLNLSFEEICENAHLIPNNILTEQSIDNGLWTRVIKHHLLNDHELVKSIIRGKIVS